MNRYVAAVAVVAALGAGAAQASTSTNQLYIISNDDDLNRGVATMSGNDNVLAVTQAHDGLGGANFISLDITGDLNGGPLAASFAPIAASTGLVPGQILQNGHGNAISLAVTGNHNLFAFSQVGAGNTLTAIMAGNNNQAAVAQIGSGNSLSFVQNGNGNVLSVIQRSR